MRKRRFADSRYVFEKEMPARQERDQAHFDHMRFALDHPRDILLDSLNGFCWIHIGLQRGILLENGLVIRHRRSLTKGLETVNYSSFLRLYDLASGHRVYTRGLRRNQYDEPWGDFLSH